MSLLPDTLTPVTAVEMFAALSAAAPELPRASLLVLLAQSALETGHWKSMHCFNVGNSKHIEGATDGAWTYFPCNEILFAAEARRFLAAAQPRAAGHPSRGPAPLWRMRRDGELEAVDGAAAERAASKLDVEVRGERLKGGKFEVWFYPSHRGCRFRAFDSLDAGVEAYMRSLRTRYAAAWPAVLAGDPERFCRTLKALKYFTADEEAYARSVVQLFRQFDDLTWVAGALMALGYEASDVFSFQRAASLTPDGIAGPKTRAALGIALRDRGLA